MALLVKYVCHAKLAPVYMVFAQDSDAGPDKAFVEFMPGKMVLKKHTQTQRVHRLEYI